MAHFRQIHIIYTYILGRHISLTIKETNLIITTRLLNELQ